jgi:hypothetical protein
LSVVRFKGLKVLRFRVQRFNVLASGVSLRLDRARRRLAAGQKPGASDQKLEK